MQKLDTRGGVEPPGSAFAAQRPPRGLPSRVQRWPPQWESNPHLLLDRQPSWPLDDGERRLATQGRWRRHGVRQAVVTAHSSHATGVLGAPGHKRRALLVDLAGCEPASSACKTQLGDKPLACAAFASPTGRLIRLRRTACSAAVGRQARMVAGEGIAPSYLAYETRLDLSPANPQCGGVARNRTAIAAMPRQRRANWTTTPGPGRTRAVKQLPVGDTDDPMPVREDLGLEASGHVAPQRQNGGPRRARTADPRVANAVLFR